MTAKETKFLRELRKVMREYRVELTTEYYGSTVSHYFQTEDGDINIEIDDSLGYDLRDKGGNRDEV